MLTESALQFINQGGLHVAIFVRDVQADNALPLQGLREILFQDATVLFLHDENEVRPTDVPFVDTDPGAGFSPGRLHRIPWNTSKRVLGGQAPDLVLAANEEQFQGFIRAAGFESKPPRAWTSSEPAAISNARRVWLIAVLLLAN